MKKETGGSILASALASNLYCRDPCHIDCELERVESCFTC
jgi:hypothetical protein